MKIKGRRGMWCILVIVSASMLLFGTSIGADNSQKYLKNFKVFEPAKPLLDPDIQIKPEFVEGKGAPIFPRNNYVALRKAFLLLFLNFESCFLCNPGTDYP